jgi:LmbE family N-acetylglucosaminyl deacetylase
MFKLPRLSPRTLMSMGSLGLLAAAILLGFLEYRRVAGLYWYEVTADQNYAFSDARLVPVAVDRQGFDWPVEAGETATALLAIDVRAGWWGRWSEPSVEIRAGDEPVRVQHFERGVSGRRFFNLGEVARGTGRVDLRGNHLRWDAGAAELLLFEASLVDTGTVLILAPHPDDAEIAAFGVYSTTDSWVVTVSAGNNVDARMAHLESDPAARSRLKGELRVYDSVSVPLWGGVPSERAMNLGYFNQSLAALYREPGSIVTDPVLQSADILPFRSTAAMPALAGREPVSSWNSLVADLVAIVDFVSPAIIVTPHPSLDAAPDHKLTTVALIEALEELGATDIELLLYTNHATGSEYFPFGPADAVVSLPPWTGAPLQAAGVLSVPLDDDQRLRKLYALEAHHDLRPAPRIVGTSPSRRIGGKIVRGLEELLHDPSDTYSYMRRGPRPNEIFLTLSNEDAGLLLEEVGEFLEDARAGRVRGGGY